MLIIKPSCWRSSHSLTPLTCCPAAFWLVCKFLLSNQQWVSVQWFPFPSLNYSRKWKMQPQEGRGRRETGNFWKWLQEKEEWAGVGRTGVGVSKFWFATIMSIWILLLTVSMSFFFFKSCISFKKKKNFFPPILKQQQHPESAVWAVISIKVLSGSEPLWKQFEWYSWGVLKL